MNTRPVIDESAGPVSLSASFNNDASCFAVGLDSGFCGMHRVDLLTMNATNTICQFSIQIHANSKFLEVLFTFAVAFAPADAHNQISMQELAMLRC